MAKKKRQDDALEKLLTNATFEILVDLVLQLAADWPDIRRECFDYLKSNTKISEKLAKRSKGEVILALWDELVPDLSELDDYGGGDYAKEDFVAELLCEIKEQLDSKEVAVEHRRQLLDLAFPYIDSGNSGLGDVLDEVAHAACYDNDDWRNLAESYEAIDDEWKIGLARSIYRRIGDRDKYLELRNSKMAYGGDFHDLSTFYWDSGEKEKALQVAEEGLKKGKGRMDELRQFVAERAIESGDRDKYLSLQFDRAMDGLTFEKYKTFKKICTPSEWTAFEPKVLSHVEDAWGSEHLKIRMQRREYDDAVGILTREGYPKLAWDSDYEIKAAKKLEKHYPEQILKYYISGLGNLNANAVRKEYARKSKVMQKVRHLLVEVMGDPKRWQDFAGKIKKDNSRRPAFQDEFSKVVPGWRDLS